MVTIERNGKRVYLVGNTYAAKDEIKALGAHWDAERRAWWIGDKKLAKVETLVAELNGGAPAAAATVGMAIDTPAPIVADRLRDDGREAEADAILEAAMPKQENPDNIRLTGKGRYKGRVYYAGAITKDGRKVRLLTLPDAEGRYLDFWAECAAVEEVKRYEPRQVWDGRRYSNRTVTQYTTLGSIAEFIARQQRNKGTDRERVQCMECDAWHDAGEPCNECGGC